MPHSETPSPVDDWDRMCESPQFRHFTIGADQGGSSIRIIRGKVMVKTVEGVQKLDIFQYSASANSNPALLPKLVIYTRRVDSSTAGSSMRVMATLYYKTQLYDRNLKRTVD